MPTRDERRPCVGATKVHDDAVRIVNFILNEGKWTDLTNEQLATKCGFWQEQGSIRRLNMPRFHKAVRHTKDRCDEEGNPCCYWTLHYRSAGPSGSVLALIDPTGDLGTHAKAVVGQLYGSMNKQKSQETENRRDMESWQLLAKHAGANGDLYGHSICMQAGTDLRRYGHVRADTMAELELWMSGIAS